MPNYKQSKRENKHIKITKI